MTKRDVSIGLAVVHAVLGIVPLATLGGIHRSTDSGMAWGLLQGMLVAPLWLLFLIVAFVVDLRKPRTVYASLASLAFPIGFVVAMFVAG